MLPNWLYESRYDYIDVRDGPSSSSPSLGRFCHSSSSSITSTGSEMFIKFRSDYSEAGRGFHVRYFTGKMELTTFLLLSKRKFTPQFSVCNNEVAGHDGIIESRNFPRPYPHNR